MGAYIGIFIINNLNQNSVAIEWTNLRIQPQLVGLVPIIYDCTHVLGTYLYIYNRPNQLVPA